MFFIEETNLDDSIGSIPALPATEKSPEIEESIRSGDSEKSVSELSSDPSPEASILSGIPEADAGRADALNATMIIKSEAQLKEDVAEEISRSILEQLIDETVEETIRRSRQSSGSQKAEAEKPSADVLQRVNVLLSGGNGSGRSSQIYMTTTFDIFSSDESDEESGSPEATASGCDRPVDVTSAEGRTFLASKLEQIEV